MVRQQHQFFVALLAAVDAAVITAVCFGAWLITRVMFYDFFPAQWESYIKNPLLPVAVPLVLLAMQMNGMYRPRRDGSILAEQLTAIRAGIFGFAATLVVLWLIEADLVVSSTDREVASRMIGGYTVGDGRFQLALLGLTLPLVLAGHRGVFRFVLRTVRKRGWNLRHVAVIGVGRLGQIAGRTIERNSWTGIKVVYYINHRDQTRRERCLDKPVHGGLAELEQTLDANPVDAVYLAIPNSHASRLPELLERLERFAVDVRVIPDVQPRHLPQAMTVSELEGMPILSYRESPTYGLGGVSKRLLDIVGSAFGLVLLSPVMLICAIAVRLSGPGRVIFKQRRVSIAGETFKIYKFRTMYHVEDEKYGGWTDEKWTERNDPRITPIGRLLRRTSLDELPQLLNVLKGQMSLVGPRPERPELIARFREDWRGYMLRQHVKAGITGWAQVNGLRGDTSLRKRLQYDLHYVRHWSIWFDVKILVLTVFRLHRNAH
ncbi:MAG: undecaprenyl-phosphate glucose phosphotransferase [Planctomycetota bacterium]